jgi:hypothetical protein
MIFHLYYYVGHRSPFQALRSLTEWSELASLKEECSLFIRNKKKINFVKEVRCMIRKKINFDKKK